MKNVRIFFTKQNRMKFISHLDMTRFMSRLITKSKIPVWYTEGFNQHVYMNFAVPLSLGFEGLYEILDIRIMDDSFSDEDCLKALNSVTVPDVKFIKVTEPVLNMKEIGFAKFELSFEELTNDTIEKLREFFSRESVICQKSGKKGRIKEVDIIPKIRSWELDGNNLTLTLTAGNEDNLNPTLVMSAFFDETKISPLFYSVKRTAILTKNGALFE